MTMMSEDCVIQRISCYLHLSRVTVFTEDTYKLSLCLDSYSCCLANTWNMFKWHMVGRNIFTVCHHAGCALILCDCQGFSQTLAYVSVKASLADQRVNCALLCPALCCSDFWEICGIAMNTRVGLCKFDDETMGSNLPVLPVTCFLEAMKK